MPKFAKIILACLICLAVVGGLIWLVQRLAG
jgi:flagellar biogenesis protein FliO